MRGHAIPLCAKALPETAAIQVVSVRRSHRGSLVAHGTDVIGHRYPPKSNAGLEFIMMNALIAHLNASSLPDNTHGLKTAR